MNMAYTVTLLFLIDHADKCVLLLQFATGGALMQSSGFPPQQGNAPGNPYANRK